MLHFWRVGFGPTFGGPHPLCSALVQIRELRWHGMDAANNELCSRCSVLPIILQQWHACLVAWWWVLDLCSSLLDLGGILVCRGEISASCWRLGRPSVSLSRSRRHSAFPSLTNWGNPRSGLPDEAMTTYWHRSLVGGFVDVSQGFSRSRCRSWCWTFPRSGLLDCSVHRRLLHVQSDCCLLADFF
jgi:hypothetical protein